MASLNKEPKAALTTRLDAIDHVLGQDDGWKRDHKLVRELAAAFALAVPRPETEAIATHLAVFQRVVEMIRKQLADDHREPDEVPGRNRDVGAAVRQAIGGMVSAGERRLLDLSEDATRLVLRQAELSTEGG